MRLLKIPLLDLMPRRDRVVIAAAAFLYMAGQLCEGLLHGPGIATDSAALLMVAAGGVYVMALLYARHLSYVTLSLPAHFFRPLLQTTPC